MEFRPILSGSIICAGLMLLSPYGMGRDIYRCEVNGVVQFTEEKCDKNAQPVQLKGLAAPLEPFDLKKIQHMDASIRRHMIQERITLRQNRIKTHRRNMEKELKAIRQKAQPPKGSGSPRASSSVRDQEETGQLRTLADSGATEAAGNLSEQMKSVISHYKTLIEAEQFQIDILLQELKVMKELNTPGS